MAAEWSNNNLSCISTWIGLRILEQNKKVFDRSGTVRMRALAFWNTGATQQMRALQARTLAKQLDNIFRLVDGAEYEPDVSGAKAVAEMAEILADADQTLADLAEVNNRNYRFWGEVV
jgi:hypothetical protein